MHDMPAVEKRCEDGSTAVAVSPVATDRAVVVRGLRLHTRRRPGSAKPSLLLLHGIGGSLDSWEPLLAALPDRDILMVDSPGAGRSDVPAHPIFMSVIADYVADVVRQAEIVAPVDVLGYSLGGLVAQELARRHPALVRRLVLVSTIMGFHGPPPKLKVQLALMSPARYTNPAAYERQIPLLAGGRTARDPAALAAIIASRVAHPPSQLGYLYQQLGVIGWSSRGWLSELRTPALVLHGDEDPVVDVVNGRMLADRITDAELEVVPGGGHMLLFDESEKAAAILEPFLAG